MGMMSAFIPGCRDAWEFTLDTLFRFYERVRTLPADSPQAPEAPPLTGMPAAEPQHEAAELVGTCNWKPRAFWAGKRPSCIWRSPRR